jgi:exodeoxyribonuclease VII small subunit
MSEAKEANFEASMKRLQEIVEDLENGELSLDQSLKLYEEGVRLSQSCMKRLTEAQQKIEMLTRGASGELRADELDAGTLKPKARKGKGRV